MRSAPGILVALVVLMVAVLLSLSVGSKSVPPGEVWLSLVGSGSGYNDTVVESRIPRTMLGVLVGAALAVAGVVLQGLTRNPLADPGILGVNVGAGAAIVTATAFLGLGAGSTSVWIAMPGAFVATALVYWLGSGGRGADPVRLVLAGAVVSAIVAAYIQALSLSLPDVFDTYRYWVVGSLAGRAPGTALEILPFVAVGLVLSAALGPALDTLAMGEDTALALGAHPARTRLLGGIAVAVLSGSATAACGPIGFVGLAVPHIVRSFTGSGHPRLLGYSVVLGPVLVLLADVVGRVIVSPSELMVGVVTAFIGGPFLLAAVRRSRSDA